MREGRGAIAKDGDTSTPATTSSSEAAAERRDPWGPVNEEELWREASEWVCTQVLVTFRHRAILSRLSPVMGVHPPIDVMLCIELPATPNAIPAASSGASTSPLRDGESRTSRALVLARAVSKSSIQQMTAAIRQRIKMLDDINNRPPERPRKYSRLDSFASRLSRTADSRTA